MASPSSNKNRKKKILFVDDEPDLTFVFKEGLEYAGLSVDVFNNSVDTLKDFKPHFYDLVMLDIIMPEMDGFDLYKKLDPDVKCSNRIDYNSRDLDSHLSDE